MASSQSHQAQANKLTVSTSPESDGVSGGGEAAQLPKGQCLCSPTTHEGSFRCRFHRSSSGTGSSSFMPPWMKRSKSMAADHNKDAVSVSPP